MGARGVRTISSKLLLALFPSNTPFFKYSIDDVSLRQLEQEAQMPEGQRGEIEMALSARERAVLQEMETALFRPAAFVALQHLVATGNYLLYIPPKNGRVRGYRLDQYVVRRDPAGHLLEIIIKEQVNPASVPLKVRKAVENGPEPAIKARKKDKTTEVEVSNAPVPSVGADSRWDMYTRIYRNFEANRWDIYQEINGVEVPDSRGHYPIEKLPFLPLRLSTQPNEDYGRSYVEEYLGDLDSLEGLVQSIVEGTAAIARIVFLVSPNGTTNLRVVARAKNGDVVAGDPNDVGTMRADKAADFSVARQQAQDIAQSLAFAFLLNTAIQRNGERVTAEEIRYMAAELDDAMGGVYTLLGAEFQLPCVKLFEARMEENRSVPPLPKDMVQPTIVAGMEAIGRGHDQRNLKLFVSDIVQVVGPENAMKAMHFRELLKRSAASYGIDPVGLIPSDEEVAQQEQMEMLMQFAQQLGPEGLKQLGGLAQQQMKISADQAQPQPQG